MYSFKTFRLFPVMALWVAVIFSFPGFSRAAEPFRQMVTDVVVRFSGGAAKANPEDFVRSRITAEKNRYISQAELAKDQRDLLETGTFSDVRIYLEKNGEGVRVVYEVVVASRFRPPLVVTGNDEFSARTIRNEFNLAEGEHVDQARLDILCDKLRAKYRDSYYPHAKVSAKLSKPDANGFSTISVHIDEGEKVRLTRFEFIGNKALSRSDLNKILERPSRWNPFYVFYSAWRKQALDFERVHDLVTRAYRDLGYLDVEVAPPELVREKSGSASVMKVTIKEGPRYTVDSVSVSGVSLYPEEDLLKIAKTCLHAGDFASASLISATAKQLENYYGQRGYARTSVHTAFMPVALKGNAPKDQMPVKISFAIREGVLAHVRSVQIRGNTRTKDKVIRRELMVAPGQLYNEVAAERSRVRLENLGYFSAVRHDIDILPGEEKDLGLTYFGDVGFKAVPSRDDEALVDLFYDVEEKNTGQLMVGIGTSSVDDILGYVEISQNNFDLLHWPFTGGGQKARLSLELGTDSRCGEMTWSDPWFLDRRQNLSIELYRREIGFSEYDETRSGGGVSLTEPLKYGRLSFRLGGELVESDEFVPGDYTLRDDPEQKFRYDEIDDSYVRVPARITWSYDTRNRPFVPTRGSRNSVYTEIQNSSLGSDYDNYKIGVDLRQYIPLWESHVLSLRLRAETMDSYGDSDEIPLNDRLYLGGSRTIRGFRYREVGPKALPVDEVLTTEDVEYHHRRARPVGGRTLAMFSAEYTYQIVDSVRLAAWFDIGNVWADAFDADFGDYAASCGIGIRLDIPSLPIRIDYAFPQHEDDEYSRKEHFIFWIGFD